MKIAKYITLFLVVGFFGIVLTEQLPGAMVPTAEPHVSLFFGLFEISLLDDITHFLSGLLGIIAVIAGPKWMVKYLMIIGGYYFLDASFFVINGFATSQPIMENLALNFPHIVITALVAVALSKSVKNIELA
ncbi:MAG: hypothetical protein RLZZ67_600 [Candidatus Parcubacteria bacterium]|jgi:hypothetical protein